MVFGTTRAVLVKHSANAVFRQTFDKKIEKIKILSLYHPVV